MWYKYRKKIILSESTLEKKFFLAKKEKLKREKENLTDEYLRLLKKYEEYQSFFNNYISLLLKHGEIKADINRHEKTLQRIYRWHIKSDNTLSELKKLQSSYLRRAKYAHIKSVFNDFSINLLKKIFSVAKLREQFLAHLRVENSDLVKKVDSKLLRNQISSSTFTSYNEEIKAWKDSLYHQELHQMLAFNSMPKNRYSLINLYRYFKRANEQNYYLMNYYFSAHIELKKSIQREIYFREGKTLDYLSNVIFELTNDADSLLETIKAYRKENKQLIAEALSLHENKDNLRDGLLVFSVLSSMSISFSMTYFYLNNVHSLNEIISIPISLMISVCVVEGICRVFDLLSPTISIDLETTHDANRLRNRVISVMSRKIASLESKLETLEAEIANINKILNAKSLSLDANHDTKSSNKLDSPLHDEQLEKS